MGTAKGTFKYADPCRRVLIWPWIDGQSCAWLFSVDGRREGAVSSRKGRRPFSSISKVNGRQGSTSERQLANSTWAVLVAFWTKIPKVSSMYKRVNLSLLFFQFSCLFLPILDFSFSHKFPLLSLLSHCHWRWIGQTIRKFWLFCLINVCEPNKWCSPY